MKIQYKIIYILIFALIIFNSCKKGEDDPFFSFRTRTARLSGNWKLTNLEGIVKSSSSNNDTVNTSIYSYSNGYLYTDKYGNNDTIRYSLEYHFSKSGVYTINIIEGNNKDSIEGIWTWVSKNKDKNLKNKEAIILTKTNSSNITYSGKNLLPENFLVIKELRNNKLVFIFKYKFIFDNIINDINIEYTFKKQ